jgi:hypothetical protein
MTESERGFGVLLEDLESIKESISYCQGESDRKSLLRTRVLLSDIPYRIRTMRDTLDLYCKEHRLRLSCGTWSRE